MYDTHWRLTGRPFQLTPDPRFWFDTETHRKAMTYLGYGLAQGEGFVVITGDIGAGKTTLIAHLLTTLDRQHLAPINIVSTAIEAEDLLRIVARQLGLEAEGMSKAELLAVIERGLHAVARSGRRTLLIVDEAQALPVSALEELRMLSNFQAGGYPLLQIVLLGQPEFRERLNGSDRLEQLRQRVIAIHHLDPMEEDEVADYIAHRLSVVGWTGQPDFAADAFPAFFRGSGGVPRRLNLLAGRVMLHAAVENLIMIDAAVVDTVLADLHDDLPIMASDITPPRPAATVSAAAVSATVASPASVERAATRTANAVPLLRTAPPQAARGWFVSSKPAPTPVVGARGGWFASTATPGSTPVVPAPPPRRGWFASTLVPKPQPVTPRLASVAAAEQVEPSTSPLPTPVAEVSTAAVTPAKPASAPVGDRSLPSDLIARVAALEERVDAQDAALRRVLTLLVDWVETDGVKMPAPTCSAAVWPDAA